MSLICYFALDLKTRGPNISLTRFSFLLLITKRWFFLDDLRSGEILD